MEIVKLPLSFCNRVVIIKCTASKGHLDVRENERKKDAETNDKNQQFDSSGAVSAGRHRVRQ